MSSAIPIFDIHSHWGTERGYPLRDPQSLALQRHSFSSDAKFVSEQEMTDTFRRNKVRTILDLGFTKSLPIEEVIPFHDYAIETQRQHADVIFGNWIQVDPRTGEQGVRELRRCIDKSSGFIGFCVSASGMGFPADDAIYAPFYDLCVEAGRPVLVLVGNTASGAGKRGGGGLKLDLCHPRHLDSLAADRPELDIIAGRPAWPWQEEMIAILLHKANVTAELHGWSPRYYPDSLKREIPRRLKDRVMFGADYPLITYERLVSDWRELNYADDILERVFHRNAERLFGVATKQAEA